MFHLLEIKLILFAYLILGRLVGDQALASHENGGLPTKANKRQMQYMAGHKYNNSNESYKVQELETLTDQLTKHHPFG